jgi:hypothetical protein
VDRYQPLDGTYIRWNVAQEPTLAHRRPSQAHRILVSSDGTPGCGPRKVIISFLLPLQAVHPLRIPDGGHRSVGMLPAGLLQAGLEDVDGRTEDVWVGGFSAFAEENVKDPRPS